jgi:hypothetical protein
VVAVPTLGKAGPQALREDVVYTDWSFSITHLQTSALILKAVRSSGTLPWITMGFGNDPDSGNSDIWQVSDCKITRLAFRCGNSGPIPVEVSGVGGLLTELTSGAAAHLSTRPKMAMDAVLTRGGAAWEFLEFSCEIAHEVRVQHVGHGANVTNMRLPLYFDEGSERITGSVTRRAKSAVDLQTELQTAADFVLLMTDADASADITLTAASAKLGSEERSNSPDGQETFVSPFEALTFTLA